MQSPSTFSDESAPPRSMQTLAQHRRARRALSSQLPVAVTPSQRREAEGKVVVVGGSAKEPRRRAEAGSRMKKVCAHHGSMSTCDGRSGGRAAEVASCVTNTMRPWGVGDVRGC